MLINGRERGKTRTLKNPIAFIDYLQTIDVVYENIENHNLKEKKRLLIVFDNMIADMDFNKKYTLLLLNWF